MNDINGKKRQLTIMDSLAKKTDEKLEKPQNGKATDANSSEKPSQDPPKKKRGRPRHPDSPLNKVVFC
jgi:hypothetical protein